MSSVWTRLRGYGEASAGGKNVEARRTGAWINRMYHVYDIMGPPGRRIARHVRDSSIPLTVDGTARRVPGRGKGPGTGSGRVERRAAVLPAFVYFISIHTVPPVPRGRGRDGASCWWATARQQVLPRPLNARNHPSIIPIHPSRTPRSKWTRLSPRVYPQTL